MFYHEGLFKPGTVPFQSPIDSITERSKAFPHYIPLIQGQSPENWKGPGRKALQNEGCMLINQLLFLFHLGKYSLFVNKRFTLNFLYPHRQKAYLDLSHSAGRLPAIQSTNMCCSRCHQYSFRCLEAYPGDELIWKRLSFHIIKQTRETHFFFLFLPSLTATLPVWRKDSSEHLQRHWSVDHTTICL